MRVRRVRVMFVSLQALKKELAKQKLEAQKAWYCCEKAEGGKNRGARMQAVLEGREASCLRIRLAKAAHVVKVFRKHCPPNNLRISVCAETFGIGCS